MVTNKRIKTTESLQKRFFNGSKNLVIEIEKLMVHQSAAKKRIIFGLTILFRDFICRKTKKSKTENCTACSFTRIFHLFICYITEINLQCLLKFERLALILHPL